MQIAVVIKIAGSHAAPGKLFAEDGARLRAHIFEGATGILEHQQRLFVLYARGAHLDKVVGMAVYQKQIGVAVVVVIEEPQSPTAQHLRCGANLSGLVSKDQILLVVIETEKFPIDVGDKKV